MSQRAAPSAAAAANRASASIEPVKRAEVTPRGQDQRARKAIAGLSEIFPDTEAVPPPEHGTLRSTSVETIEAAFPGERAPTLAYSEPSGTALGSVVGTVASVVCPPCLVTDVTLSKKPYGVLGPMPLATTPPGVTE